MEASLVRLANWKIDVKVLIDERMHILQWRRHMTHDEVLLDGKTQQTSYGLWGRETIYGLVFGRDEDGKGGTQVMFVVDPTADMGSSGYWLSGDSVPSGVRLETANDLLLAFGSLDERAYEKPADFMEWTKKTFGMKW